MEWRPVIYDDLPCQIIVTMRHREKRKKEEEKRVSLNLPFFQNRKKRQSALPPFWKWTPLSS
jgi:hypothetical protein